MRNCWLVILSDHYGAIVENFGFPNIYRYYLVNNQLCEEKENKNIKNINHMTMFIDLFCWPQFF